MCLTDNVATAVKYSALTVQNPVVTTYTTCYKIQQHCFFPQSIYAFYLCVFYHLHNKSR